MSKKPALKPPLPRTSANSLLGEAPTPAAPKEQPAPTPTPAAPTPGPKEEPASQRNKSVNINETLWAATKVAAAKDRTTITSIVETAIKEHLERNGHPLKV